MGGTRSLGRRVAGGHEPLGAARTTGEGEPSLYSKRPIEGAPLPISLSNIDDWEPAFAAIFIAIGRFFRPTFVNPAPRNPAAVAWSEMFATPTLFPTPICCTMGIGVGAGMANGGGMGGGGGGGWGGGVAGGVTWTVMVARGKERVTSVLLVYGTYVADV